MSFSRGYLQQVELLLRVLPVINKQDCFALKGGTAINLFIRDMPRLSVDIDLTYLPIEPRDHFLKNITLALDDLAHNIEAEGKGKYQVSRVFTKALRQLSKLIVSNNATRIIIEPNLVLRGSVFECDTHELCKQAQDEFLSFFSVKTLSFADLYGGKICAALARQHPRDLFDIKILLEKEGLSEHVRQALVIYLASNSRPINELLNPKPNIQEIKNIFEEAFIGMSKEKVTYEELIDTRYKLIELILKSLTQNERNFLISVKSGNPDWQLIPIAGLDNLPGIRWKSLNIAKMDAKKQKIALDRLKKVLDL